MSRSGVATAVARIKDFVVHSQSGKYLLRVVFPPSQPFCKDSHSLYNITPEEAEQRQQALLRFQKLANFQKVLPSVYNGFLRLLYPHSNGLGRFSTAKNNISLVNHAVLFQHYCLLPQPGVGHLDPADLEHFMGQMLARRDFVKPNSLLARSVWYSLSELIIRNYQQAQEARKKHLNMFWRVVQDLDAAGIPVSREEQKQMVFMTFYREREDILQMVEQALQNIGKSAENYAELAEIVSRADPPFDVNTFRQFRLQFDDLDIEMLNVFLRTALRHGNTEVADELLSGLKLPNGETFRILLDSLSMKKEHERFNDVLGLLASQHIELIDIQVLNSIISALVRLGHFEMAQTIVEALGEAPEPLSDSEQFLKLLSARDRLLYREHLTALQQLENKPLVKFYATENTLFPILGHVCEHGTFSDIVNILFTIEHVWKFPLSSRIFHTVFQLFDGTHTIENLRFATAKLVTEYDVNFDGNESWIRDKLHETELPSGVSSTLGEILAETPLNSAHGGVSRFLKLSDRLMLAVYQAFESTLHLNPDLLAKVTNSKAAYLQTLSIARERDVPLPKGQPPLTKDLFRRDQYMYIKKGFLIELLDIIS